MWKYLANNGSFEYSQIIGWQVNCDNWGKILRTTHNLKMIDCDEFGEIWQPTRILKIHKWSDDKLVVMNVERIGEQRLIWKLENAMNGERFVVKPTIWKFTNDWMISQLQWMWKGLANNVQFENSQIHGKNGMFAKAIYALLARFCCENNLHALSGKFWYVIFWRPESFEFFVSVEKIEF